MSLVPKCSSAWGGHGVSRPHVLQCVGGGCGVSRPHVLQCVEGCGVSYPPLTRPGLVFQDSSYFEDFSNISIFSSSVDSLSDIVDTPDFLPADSLNQVSTIWDENPAPSTHDKVSAPGAPRQPRPTSMASLPQDPQGPARSQSPRVCVPPAVLSLSAPSMAMDEVVR